MDSAVFEEQYNTYTTFGYVSFRFHWLRHRHSLSGGRNRRYAENPTERSMAPKGFIGDKAKAAAMAGQTVYSARSGSSAGAAAAAAAADSASMEDEKKEEVQETKR
jgi:hypothetical protein